MKLAEAEARRERLALTRPYRIAGRTTSAVEIFLLALRTDGGETGLGTASPAPEVTGETPDRCGAALEADALAWLRGEDPSRPAPLLDRARERMGGTPAALAAVDMALHDLFAKSVGVPLADALGRVHDRLPTSVTIGIQPLDEALALSDELVGRGFRALKVKVGEELDADVELLRRLRERHGPALLLRGDANGGYRADEAVAFLERTSSLGIEFLEQPVAAAGRGLRALPESTRASIAADESLISEADALALAAYAPAPACGVFNIKLMKCGGIRPALRIARIARGAGIDLLWGCMDESVVGIAAALHAAFASPATRYLDLDGSFDLARDVAHGGFVVRDGEMSTTDEPGLGVAETGATF